MFSNDVSLANMMEQHGEPGMIHISESTLRCLSGNFKVENSKLKERYPAFEGFHWLILKLMRVCICKLKMNTFVVVLICRNIISYYVFKSRWWKLKSKRLIALLKMYNFVVVFRGLSNKTNIMLY